MLLRKSHSNAAYAALVVLLLLAFGLGGSSRADVPQLLWLRPASILCLGAGLITIQREHIRGYASMIGIMGFAVALPLLQSIPLPPSIWQGLPGREIVAQIDQAVGAGRLWRPVSLAPSETVNALGSMALPVAILVLGIQLAPRRQAALVTLPLAMGMLGALLGMLQLLDADDSGLYLFDITNKGSPVGLFANRNHQAVALSCLIPLGAVALRLFWPRHWPARARSAAALLGLIVTFVLVLVTGSRAGLLSSLVATALVVFLGPKMDVRSPYSGAIQRPFLPAIRSAFVAGIGLIAVWQDRDLALRRLLETAPQDDLRAEILPTLWRIAQEQGFWGTGIGSFERVYQIHEPAHLLGPAYVNHAHNDWLELLITGGWPAILLSFAAAVLITLRFSQLWSAYRVDEMQALRWAGFICIVILSLASFSDYPLRTPYLAGLFALCLVWFFSPAIQRG